MPYVVYHGDHVWGVGHTPSTAVKDAKNSVEDWNRAPDGNRKLTSGMYLLYVTKTLLNKIESCQYGGFRAAKRFKLTERKLERMFVRIR